MLGQRRLLWDQLRRHGRLLQTLRLLILDPVVLGDHNMTKLVLKFEVTALMQEVLWHSH